MRKCNLKNLIRFTQTLKGSQNTKEIINAARTITSINDHLQSFFPEVLFIFKKAKGGADTILSAPPFC